MKRRMHLAAAVLAFACSCRPGAPVLVAELGPAGGASADAVSLENARRVVERRLDAASPRNARVRAANGVLVVELDAGGAAEWPALKSVVLPRGELSFFPVAMDPPFAPELAIEVTRPAAGGILAKKDPSFGDWTYEAAGIDAATLVKNLTALVAMVTGNDPRWKVALEQPRRGKSPTAILLDREGAMEHVSVTSATPQSDDMGPRVSFTLSKEDGERFAALSGKLVGRKLAIVLDGEVHSAPYVREAITGGELQIAIGSGTGDAMAAARALAATLAAGEMVFDLEVRSEKTAPR